MYTIKITDNFGFVLSLSADTFGAALTIAGQYNRKHYRIRVYVTLDNVLLDSSW